MLTGSSGLDGDTDKLHYEEDFYATLDLGFARGFSLGTTYTAYTSPNGMFGTVQELVFKVSKAHMLAPYGIIAFELDGQADGGSNEGIYLELGVGPELAAGRRQGHVRGAREVRLQPEGLLRAGQMRTTSSATFRPAASSPFRSPAPTSKFGAWNFHGGVDVYAFGDTPKAFNNGDSGKVVASFGIGVVY